jgi:hypothetical protein
MVTCAVIVEAAGVIVSVSVSVTVSVTVTGMVVEVTMVDVDAVDTIIGSCVIVNSAKYA